MKVYKFSYGMAWEEPYSMLYLHLEDAEKAITEFYKNEQYKELAYEAWITEVEVFETFKNEEK